MLKTEKYKFYKIKAGQTVKAVADAFCIPVTLLIRENGLTEEVRAGDLIRIPQVRGNLYTVRAEDTKELLCGSSENYEKMNGTELLYPEMKIFI